MVVPSLNCMNPIQSSIANGEVSGGVGGVSKSPKCKVVLKYGRKVAKTEEQKELLEEPSLQRRVSTRIAKQKADKALLVRRRVELLADKGDGDEKKTSKRSRRNGKYVGKEEVVKEEKRVDAVMKSNARTKLEGKSTIAGLEEKVESGSGAANAVGKSDSAKVKEALRLFNKHYLHFVQARFMHTHSGNDLFWILGSCVLLFNHQMSVYILMCNSRWIRLRFYDVSGVYIGLGMLFLAVSQ